MVSTILLTRPIFHHSKLSIYYVSNIIFSHWNSNFFFKKKKKFWRGKWDFINSKRNTTELKTGQKNRAKTEQALAWDWLKQEIQKQWKIIFPYMTNIIPFCILGEFMCSSIKSTLKLNLLDPIVWMVITNFDKDDKI